jgi:hypothetical protein
MKNLEMKKVYGKMVLKNVTDNQLQQQSAVCDDLLQQINENDDCLITIINDDESKVFQNDPEIKQLIMQWRSSGSTCPKKVQISKSNSEQC